MLLIWNVIDTVINVQLMMIRYYITGGLWMYIMYIMSIYQSIFVSDSLSSPGASPKGQKNLQLPYVYSFFPFLLVQSFMYTSFIYLLLYPVLSSSKWPSSPTRTLDFTYTFFFHKPFTLHSLNMIKPPQCTYFFSRIPLLHP